MRLDIMMSIPGMTFEDAWPRREKVALADLTLPFISKDDLIKAKVASGRPQDLLDLAKLEKTEARF